MNSLFRPSMNPESFNHFKLSRADDCHAYGCDLLFAEASAKICKEGAVDAKFNSLDTSAFPLT